METLLIDRIVSMLPIMCIIVGMLAVIVSIVIEVIKNVPLFKAVPTDAIVIIVSLLVTFTAFGAYVSYTNHIIEWYMVMGTAIGGFFVAFVAMFGWEKFNDMWYGFKYFNQFKRD